MSFRNTLNVTNDAGVASLVAAIDPVFTDVDVSQTNLRTEIASVPATTFPTGVQNSEVDLSGVATVALDNITNANVNALISATSPVFTDNNTTYTTSLQNGSNASQVIFRLTSSGTTPVNDDITIVGGTNITLSRAGDTLTINAPNFSDVVTFASTAARNSSTGFTWHVGDIVIAGGSSYVYNGSTSGDTRTGTTVDGDWTELVTPSSALDAAGVLSRLNLNDGTTDINDNLIPATIQRAATAVETTDSIDVLMDVDTSTTAPTADQVLAWNGTNWVPADAAAGGATVSDTAPTSAEAGDLWYFSGGDDETDNVPRLFVYVDDGTTEAWIATAPTPELPSAPAETTSDTSYVLSVDTDGVLSWTQQESAAISLSQTSYRATLPDPVVAAVPIANFMDSGNNAAATFSAVHQVYYQGLTLVEGFDYTISGTTLTLSSTAGLTAGEFLYLVNVNASSS